MREIDKILNENEKVLWESTPQFWPFYLGRSLFLTLFGLFWSIIVFVIIIGLFLSSTGPLKYLIFLTPHFWIGIVLLFGPIIYNALVHKRMYYAITDKRVIIQSGLIGRDFDILDFDKISNAEVNVGIFDKLVGKNSGSIILSSNVLVSQNTTQKYILSSITDPYEVFKFFKKVSYDVKTDISYPNQLRPANNPGYGTEYKVAEVKEKKKQIVVRASKKVKRKK